MMGGGEGSEDVLPEGYTRLDELSLTSGSRYIQLGFTAEVGAVYKIKAVIKYFDVSSNNRYLCGFENDPWWGCDKGYFKGSNIVQFSPPSGTKVLANTWYNVSFSGRATKTSKYQYSLFRLGGPNGHLYQTYMSFKGVCNIYKNDVLIRHLIPCTDTYNREGMYDTISTTFYNLT